MRAQAHREVGEGGEEQLGDTSRGPMKLFYFYLCGLRLHADYFSFALSIALSE